MEFEAFAEQFWVCADPQLQKITGKNMWRSCETLIEPEAGLLLKRVIPVLICLWMAKTNKKKGEKFSHLHIRTVVTFSASLGFRQCEVEGSAAQATLPDCWLYTEETLAHNKASKEKTRQQKLKILG